MKNRIRLYIFIFLSLSATLFAGYKTVANIIDEWNDVDEYRILIKDKRGGVVEWDETIRQGKTSRTVQHEAPAIWIQAERVSDKRLCTWAERNPFNADGYKIGQYYDGQYIEGCNKNPSPHGDYALAWLMLCVVCFFIFAYLLED